MSGAWRLLLLGASGAIGQAVSAAALARGWHVTAASRGARAEDENTPSCRHLRYDPVSDRAGAALEGAQPFDAVCFAQGANAADSFHGFDPDAHRALYDANCVFVLSGLAALVERELLRAGGARIVLVSSIWQERARTDKLSYTVTKAATGGLVRAASVDLGRGGHLVNGVLPGVLDTPMSRANLSPEQIAAVAGKTTLGRLPDLGTLAAAICFLCSDANNSITGQSLAVDLGMSNANLL